MKRLITAKELANLLNINRETIYRQARAGKLPCAKIGPELRFDKDEVLKFLKEKNAPEMFPQKQSKLEQICKKYFIGLIYQFGSSIKNEHNELSDIDIGIIFLPKLFPENRQKAFGNIYVELQDALNITNLDLIFLEETDITIQHQAINGKYIYKYSSDFLYSYKEKILKLYQDYYYYLNLYQKEFMEGISNG